MIHNKCLQHNMTEPFLNLFMREFEYFSINTLSFFLKMTFKFPIHIFYMLHPLNSDDLNLKFFTKFNILVSVILYHVFLSILCKISFFFLLHISLIRYSIDNVE